MSFLALLASVAALLAGHPVPVACQDLSAVGPEGAGGIYYSDVGQIGLGVEACFYLRRLRAGEMNGFVAWSILALAHESMHASGLQDSGDETLTECRAIHEVGAATAVLLPGLDPPILTLAVDRVTALALAAHETLRATHPAYATRSCDGVLP